MAPDDPFRRLLRFRGIEGGLDQRTFGFEQGPGLGQQFRQVDPRTLHERPALFIRELSLQFAAALGDATDEGLTSRVSRPLETALPLLGVHEETVDIDRMEDAERAQDLAGAREESGVVWGQRETATGERGHQTGGDLGGGGFPAIVDHGDPGALGPQRTGEERTGQTLADDQKINLHLRRETQVAIRSNGRRGFLRNRRSSWSPAWSRSSRPARRPGCSSPRPA